MPKSLRISTTTETGSVEVVSFAPLRPDQERALTILTATEPVADVEADQNVAKGPRLNKAAVALAIKTQHPEWTDKQVCEAAGCSRFTLYRSEQYQAVKAMMKSAKYDRPTGYKDAKGNIDAWR